MLYKKSQSMRNLAFKVTCFCVWEDFPVADLEVFEDFETLGAIAECFSEREGRFCLEKMEKAFTVEREFMREIKFDCKGFEGFK